MRELLARLRRRRVYDLAPWLPGKDVVAAPVIAGDGGEAEVGQHNSMGVDDTSVIALNCLRDKHEGTYRRAGRDEFSGPPRFVGKMESENEGGGYHNRECR